ncbi:MAG: 2-succinyl-5-enolpyruvyl-6-hydroxy-3-cyclohexene-1-carboxylic-acid synthase [Bdellovibrionales bacterium]|nr:2-succinyl-5-enolpyruvyl-6-hydroxy-3-cyclohexene-1-carboxylic-acid synthase [Bdellovibrionales bacterium]
MTNMQLAAKVLQGLVSSGIREFCLCAGARNSPFVHILEENKDVKVYSFFEERSAAFFALGRMAKTQRPMAVITTSGTAVAELLPAAVEATYSSLPLVMVSADRPKSYRGSGAPQSIEQVGIFSYYIEASLDIDSENSHFSMKGLTWKKPVHINVCFTEPLIDGPVAKLDLQMNCEWVKFPEQAEPTAGHDTTHFLKIYNPIVILGTLPPKAQAPMVGFLKKIQCPIYAEGISGLRGHPELKHLEIRSGENYLNYLLDKGICNAILRIGGVPTIRLWRDLEDKRKHLPVLSVGFNHYSGLSREVNHFTHLASLAMIQSPEHFKDLGPILKEDLQLSHQKEELMKKYPRSEQALVWALSKKLKGQSVYVGNSLPIRHWDIAADFESYPSRVVGNRGANGIDGQVSTFLGWAERETENWCIVGDLTAMYDLASLWITPQLEDKKMRIVVINNRGGRIFQRMFKKDIFLNRHELEFSHWAKMFNWGYNTWETIPESLNLGDHEVIELIPDAEHTDGFLKEWEQVWKK